MNSRNLGRWLSGTRARVEIGVCIWKCRSIIVPPCLLPPLFGSISSLKQWNENESKFTNRNCNRKFGSHLVQNNFNFILFDTKKLDLG